MKIRTGFVSNSSSSSYIVKVPKDFKLDVSKLSEETIAHLTECENLEYDEKTNTLTKDGFNEATKMLNNAISDLQNNKGVHRGYDIDYSIFWGLIGVLKDNNFVVMDVDGAGGDGEDSIIPFEDERKK